MSDIYLQNPELLAGKPKLTCGDYVDSHGILVPRRFPSLKEAMKSGSPFLARSEANREYDGSSGLSESYLIKPTQKNSFEIQAGHVLTDSNEEELVLLSQMLTDSRQTEVERAMIMRKRNRLEEFSRFQGVRLENLISEISYSYWEYIDGFNRTIVADSAIQNRYHLFTTSDDKRGIATLGTRHDYAIIEDGNIIRHGPSSKLSDSYVKEIPGIIDFYERIRTLQNFNQNHCPLVEFQTDWEGNHHFLQYHRTRDFEGSTFSLDRSPTSTEIEIDFVRGATRPNGMLVHANVYYGKGFFPMDEEASFDGIHHLVYSELMTRRRKAQFIGGDFDRISRLSYDGGHLPKSKLFKPMVTLTIPFDEVWLDERESFRIWMDIREGKEPFSLPFRIVSDGRRAFVERLKM